MSITYRSVKGSKLTSAEVDANFLFLEEQIGTAPNLQTVTDEGNATTNVIQAAGVNTPVVQLTDTENYVALKTDTLTSDRELFAPDENGTIETKENVTSLLSNKADLVGGKVPPSQLPSYVDDVLEFANLAAFPATGESEKIYVALDTNFTYRWSGSAYVKISDSGKLDKVTTVDVEKVYIKNADGTQGMKATSDLGSTTESVTIANRWTLTSADVYYRSRADFGGFNVDTLSVSTANSTIVQIVASLSSSLYCTSKSKHLKKIYFDAGSSQTTIPAFKLGVFAFQRDNTSTNNSSAINLINLGEFTLTKPGTQSANFWEITPSNIEIPAGYLVSCVLMRVGGTGTEVNASITFKFDNYVA